MNEINVDGKAYDGRKGPINVALIFSVIVVIIGIVFVIHELI